MDRILEKIETDREILSTMPKNNKKNIANYLNTLQILKKEYLEKQKEIYDEMNKRYKKIISIKKNPDLEKEQEEIKNMHIILDTIEMTKSSFEKMGLDKRIYKFRRFYKENLENINIEILECINKFNEVGITLTSDDFNYSIFVNEYMKAFFDNMQNINSKIMKDKFEEIYWKCPNLIIHIELNFRYIYMNNKKTIDRYYKKQTEQVSKKVGLTAQEIEEKINNLQEKYNEDIKLDKYILTKKFLDGTLNCKEYEKEKIRDEYLKVLHEDIIEGFSDEKIEEATKNAIKFLHNLNEYKQYLQFEYILKDVKKKYQESSQYKNSYNETRKNILANEKKLRKLKKGLLKKNNKKDEQIAEYNDIILETKALYKQLDKDEFYIKIINNLTPSSTIYDVLKFASEFHNYLVECIIANNEESDMNQIENIISSFEEFINSPYNIIIKNITILEEKNIGIMISDRYKLLNFTIQKEDVIENFETLISILQKIENYYYIKQCNIDLSEIEFACEFKKL